jgi:hypothetical protein
MRKKIAIKWIFFHKLNTIFVQAFLRYLSTINHTLSWYQQDKEKRKVSLKTVRKLHSAANKRSTELYGEDAYMTQFDMVTTQFAFVGAAIILPEKLGFGTPKGSARQTLFCC